MKISKVEIKNFRSVRDETIDCLDFTSFVGPNGVGKSTILHALNIFFGEINSFSEEDFHNRNMSDPIKIKVTFASLSMEAEEEFSHYVRAGTLVVLAEITADEGGGFTKRVIGERLIFEPFKEFFEAKSASDRGKVFKGLKEKYEGIESATNDADRKKAIINYEESVPASDKILQPSGEDFFGVSKGSHKFQKHVSWVYVPAVKDASTESEEGKNSHLGKLIQHTIRTRMEYEGELDNIRQKALEAYHDLLESQRSHLSELEARLSEKLKAAVTTDTDLSLDWKKDEKSVSVQDPIAQVQLSDRGFWGEVKKFGHGLQRSFLLVILQELMSYDNSLIPTLILGCEEPELYQHPPQARHLAQTLSELSRSNAQVFITTHSPYFIDIDFFDGIKVVRNESAQASVRTSTLTEILEGYNNAFNRPILNETQARTKLAIQTQPKFNEIFFADKVILIEGISDLACFETYLRLSGRKSEFQKSGAAFVVCEGKSSLALMLLIAKSFSIPYHVVFDCDGNCQAHHADEHLRDNNAILGLSGHEVIAEFPKEHLFLKNLTAWRNDIEHTLDAEFGPESELFKQAGRDAVGNLRNSKKHPMYVAASMAAAWKHGQRFPSIGNAIEKMLET